jgi:predicted Zn-ribbon and HTH transcriptional regulator
MVNSADYSHYKHYGYNPYGQRAHSAEADRGAARPQAGRSSGCLKTILTVLGLGALAGGAALAYHMHEKEGALVNDHKPMDCTGGLSLADKLVSPFHKNNLLKKVWPNCSDQQKELAASQMCFGEREQAYTDLSQEQLKGKNYPKALEFTRELKEGAARDDLLQEIATVAPDLKEKAFDLMSVPKKEAAYAREISSLLHTPKEKDAIRMLKKIQTEYNSHRIRGHLIENMSDPSSSLQLAKTLPNGPEKDNAYLQVASQYAEKRDCVNAIDVARTLNVEDPQEVIDSLKNSFLSLRAKAYRLQLLADDLQNGVREQQVRLKAVAANCPDLSTQLMAEAFTKLSNQQLASDLQLIADKTPSQFSILFGRPYHF